MDAAIAALKAGRYDDVEDAFRTRRINPRSDGSTILHIAVGDNSTQGVELLLRLDAHPTYSWQFTKCHTLDIFKLLARYKWRVKENAVQLIPYLFDHLEIVDWLLDQGQVDLNSSQDLVLKGNICRVHNLKKNEFDHTSGFLNEAARAGKPEVFDFLVSRGADPLQSLALHYATELEPEDSANVEAMIDHLVEKYQFDVNDDDWTRGGLVYLVGVVRDHPLHGPPLRTAVYKHNTPAVRALLRHGADPERGVRSAIRVGDMDILRILLEAGADATGACNHACFSSNMDAIKLCLGYGADPGPALQEDADRVASNSAVKPLTDAMKRLLEESIKNRS